MNTFDLQRDAFGHWVLTMPDGTRHAPVTALRSYPVTAPDAGVALMDAEGHELYWVDALSDLPDNLRQRIEHEIKWRALVPEHGSVWPL